MKLGSGPLSFWLLLLFAACIFLKMSTNVAFMLNFGKCTGQGSVGIRCDLPKMTQTNAVQTAGESRELWRNTVKQTALEALDPSSLSPLALTSSPQANSHHCEMVVILFVTTRWSHSVLLLPDHTSIEGWRNFERGKVNGEGWSLRFNQGSMDLYLPKVVCSPFWYKRVWWMSKWPNF